MDGFSKEERAQAWWATDSRRAVSGQLYDVLREKRGEIERADLSGIEAVRMGLIMQPAIADIFTDITKINTSPLDDPGTHRTQPWLRAHFDFVTEDGGLLEVKNFNAAVANKYGEMDEPIRIPEADYIQCLHEATVRDVPHVYFAVLFGGQQFRYWKLEFTPAEKEAFIQRAAQWWGYVHSGMLPEPTNTEEAAIRYPRSMEGYVTANAQMERLADELKLFKMQAKQLEEAIEARQFAIQSFMGESATLMNMAGETLVTWKSAKGSKRFDAKAFKENHPGLYAEYEKETAGSRRFLVK
jgi:predicted phage-related endonuclease